MPISEDEYLAMKFARILGHDVWDGWRVYCVNNNNFPILNNEGKHICYDIRTLLHDYEALKSEAVFLLQTNNITDYRLDTHPNGYNMFIRVSDEHAVEASGMTKNIAIMRACIKLHHKLKEIEHSKIYVQPLYFD